MTLKNLLLLLLDVEGRRNGSMRSTDSDGEMPSFRYFDIIKIFINAYAGSTDDNHLYLFAYNHKER